MFKNYFKGIEGIADYPVLSLLVFFLFFISITVWCFRADKKYLKALSNLPLADDQKQKS